MQAILRKIHPSANYSFVSRVDYLPVLYDKWHFHPELELTHIVQSRGTRFVGDSIEEFKEDDLVLLGSSLPHVWKNDSGYYSADSELMAESRVLQFLPDCFGTEFLNLKEMEPVRRLFEKAKRGLRITGTTRTKVLDSLSQLIIIPSGIQRIALFLQILETIAESDELVYLSSEGFLDSYHRFDTDTINRIYEFTLSQFHRRILIEEAASLANMSVANFCRYFKNRTQKTYIQFLTEVRIGYACRMLMEDKKSIQQIAMDCGFHNLSNFNRSFRMLKNQKPSAYRASFSR
ncbi:AraC family transcriptional regulator [Arundinibacter roseus]|uniref:AraC family transcriptional regulator n=1 Tax=Arundinibacter roseus TaxID=2070510 RepID=A0A4R4KH78_9BACT|nr:AraC family transcriptional regulator [Arundinibacter roseus]TDB65929.1 AraC family transcriptional regulator [Arundinibacter roseus]